MLGFQGTTIFLRNSLNDSFSNRFAIAFLCFGLMPFMIVWTVIGTIWYFRIPDLSCVRARQMPEDITMKIVLHVMLMYNYGVSALAGIIYFIGLYFCCCDRSRGLRSEHRQDNFELSSVHQPSDNEHLEQLEPCIVGSEETHGVSCTICNEDFDSSSDRPLRLPLCSHISHEDCIKDY